MTASGRRVSLVPGYVLHHQPWRDTSRILEVLTRDHGRLTLFARGVRGPKSRLTGLLQPFAPLLFSWTGSGEAGQLTAAEPDPSDVALHAPLPPACILPGFYLSELVMTLTARHDPQPELFDHYHRALSALKGGAVLARELRLFEKRLLDTLGYGIDLAMGGEGEVVDDGKYYHYRPSDGLHDAVADSPGRISGATLRSLAEERLEAPEELEQARRLLRVALSACLEGRSLKTRKVARSLFQLRQSA
jgi:DNA repair protein RecO (recombination protein O)